MEFYPIVALIVLLQVTLLVSGDQSLHSLIVGNDENIKFSYQNCGPPSDPLQVQALSVAPDPIHFPGNLTISAAVSLTTNVSSPVTVALKIIKKVGPFTVLIPCVDNVGSCTYADLCKMLPTPDKCPDFFVKHDIPCDCPFPLGKYGVQNLMVNIETKEPVPNGQYQITADISSNGSHIGCLYIVANYQ